MTKQIERQPSAMARIGAKRTQFRENYILHDDGDPWVPGTDSMVPRLRRVHLGPKSIGFFSDEVDRVIDALRRWRDRQASLPRRATHTAHRRAADATRTGEGED